MDTHVVIDGKKYITSKRAAKLFGYTKDYVGQMAREGRIDAKLIGRSWYVYEGGLQHKRKEVREQDSKEELNETLDQDEKVNKNNTISSRLLSRLKHDISPVNIRAILSTPENKLLADFFDYDTGEDIPKVVSDSFALTREPTVFELQRKREQDKLLADMTVEYDEGIRLFYDASHTLPYSVTNVTKEAPLMQRNAAQKVSNKAVSRMLQRPSHSVGDVKLPTKRTYVKKSEPLHREKDFDDMFIEEEEARSPVPFARLALASIMLLLAIMGTVLLSTIEKKTLVNQNGSNQPASVSTEFQFGNR